MKKHFASAIWQGSISEGEGKISTNSKVLNNDPYSFKSRFENGEGTNPDELLAASHAGCFVMALSLILGKAGYTPEYLEASAEVTMDADKLELTESHLKLKAKVPKISKDKFFECADAAKNNCPISKALSVKISMEAILE